MKIKHYLRVISSLLYTSTKQRTFLYKGHKLNYVYKKGKNNKLLIVFPAIAKKAKYNYVLTLKNIDSHILFLKDDFDGRVSYFIGTKGDFFCIDLVDELVLSFLKKYQIEDIGCLGSSKGGTSALLFSLRTKHKVQKAILGSPQYCVGEYLYYHGGQEILEHICGHASHLNAQQLDDYCQKSVLNSVNNPHIVLFSSTKEDEFHLKETRLLIHDLEKRDLSFEFIDGNFTGHTGLASAFKEFISKNKKAL